MPDRIRLRLLVFLLVGLVNTAVGAAIIAGGIVAGLPPLLANALGFIVGLCVSFLLNSRLTFGSDPRSARLLARYLLAFLAAYGCNLVCVLLLDRVWPHQVIATHVLGIVPYTIAFFLLAEFFVFDHRRRPREGLVGGASPRDARP